MSALVESKSGNLSVPVLVLSGKEAAELDAPTIIDEEVQEQVELVPPKPAGVVVGPSVMGRSNSALDMLSAPDALVLSPAKTWTELNAWTAFIPAMIVYPLWIYTMAKNNYWEAVFSEYWPGTLGMILGSFIAGSTPLGGGVVAFPLSVLVFEFTSAESRDASVLVQSVGMNSAAFLLFITKRHLLNNQIIFQSCLFAAIGITAGIWQPADSFVVNMTYTIFISMFAILYYYIKRQKDPVESAVDAAHDALSGSVIRGLRSVVNTPSFPFESPSAEGPLGKTPRRDLVLWLGLAASGLIGGYVTAMVGSGSDMAMYIFGLFWWNWLCPEKHLSDSALTASSVVVMGAMSAFTVVMRALNGGFSERVLLSWGGMACIVCLGAPLGSIVLSPSAEPYLRTLFYVLAVVQLISFGILKIQDNMDAWIVTAVLIGVELIVLVWMGRKKAASKDSTVSPSPDEAKDSTMAQP